MNDILNALKGKKTFLIAACLGFAAFAAGMGWITEDQRGIIETALIGAGLAALRAGVGK